MSACVLVQGFKVGLCDKAPVGTPHSLLCLSNNTCIAETFDAMCSRFQRLYKRQVYVHHYTQYMDVDGMQTALANVSALKDAYREVEGLPEPELIYEPAPTRRA